MKNSKISVILGFILIITNVSCKGIIESIAPGLEKIGHGIVLAQPEEEPHSIARYRIKPHPDDPDQKFLQYQGSHSLYLRGAEGHETYDLEFSRDKLGKHYLVTSLGKTYSLYDEDGSIIRNNFPIIQPMVTDGGQGYVVGPDIQDHLIRANSVMQDYIFADSWWDGKTTNYFVRFAPINFGGSSTPQHIVLKFDIRANLIDTQYVSPTYQRPPFEHELSGTNRLEIQNNNILLDGEILPIFSTNPNISGQFTPLKIEGLVYTPAN